VKKPIKRPHQQFDLVEVIWDDAASLDRGWTKELAPPVPQLALSVGFLVQQTEEHMQIAMDLDATGHWNGESQIPRGMVKKIKVLRKKDA
jgi:hypothetical protein